MSALFGAKKEDETEWNPHLDLSLQTTDVGRGLLQLLTLLNRNTTVEVVVIVVETWRLELTRRSP